MFIVTHARAGSVLCVSTTPSANGLYSSIFASNFTYPIGTYWVQPEGMNGDYIAESRRAIDIADMSHARLVLYQGCETGADPPDDAKATPPSGHKNLLYSTAAPRDDWSKGAACAVGFQGTVGNGHLNSSADYWATRLCYYLTGGWTVRDACYWATNDMYNHTSYGYDGYDSHYWRGNGDTRY